MRGRSGSAAPRLDADLRLARSTGRHPRRPRCSPACAQPPRVVGCRGPGLLLPKRPVILVFGLGSMARLPIRFEVGVNGMQVFARRETTWIPWEAVDRVDIVRVSGNPHVVAWSRYADRFPDLDTFGGGPCFLPRLGAIAVCPLNVLRARRHEVIRALDRYAGNRI